MTAAEAQGRAVAAMERLLADAPPCTAQEAVEAMRACVALRDLLVAQRRREGPSAELDRRLSLANAAVSLTWSGTVPVIGFRRGRLEKAREALLAEADGNRTHLPG